MTNDMQRMVDKAVARCDHLALMAQRAAIIVERMQTLGALDEFTDEQEQQWAELEKQYRFLATELV